MKMAVQMLKVAKVADNSVRHLRHLQAMSRSLGIGIGMKWRWR